MPRAQRDRETGYGPAASVITQAKHLGFSLSQWENGLCSFKEDWKKTHQLLH